MHKRVSDWTVQYPYNHLVIPDERCTTFSVRSHNLLAAEGENSPELYENYDKFLEIANTENLTIESPSGRKWNAQLIGFSNKRSFGGLLLFELLEEPGRAQGGYPIDLRNMRSPGDSTPMQNPLP